MGKRTELKPYSHLNQMPQTLSSYSVPKQDISTAGHHIVPRAYFDKALEFIQNLKDDKDKLDFYLKFDDNELINMGILPLDLDPNNKPPKTYFSTQLTQLFDQINNACSSSQTKENDRKVTRSLLEKRIQENKNNPAGFQNDARRLLQQMFIPNIGEALLISLDNTNLINLADIFQNSKFQDSLNKILESVKFEPVSKLLPKISASLRIPNNGLVESSVLEQDILGILKVEFDVHDNDLVKSFLAQSKARLEKKLKKFFVSELKKLLEEKLKNVNLVDELLDAYFTWPVSNIFYGAKQRLEPSIRQDVFDMDAQYFTPTKNFEALTKIAAEFQTSYETIRIKNNRENVTWQECFDFLKQMAQNQAQFMKNSENVKYHQINIAAWIPINHNKYVPIFLRLEDVSHRIHVHYKNANFTDTFNDLENNNNNFNVSKYLKCREANARELLLHPTYFSEEHIVRLAQEYPQQSPELQSEHHQASELSQHATDFIEDHIEKPSQEYPQQSPELQSEHHPSPTKIWTVLKKHLPFSSRVSKDSKSPSPPSLEPQH